MQSRLIGSIRDSRLILLGLLLVAGAVIASEAALVRPQSQTPPRDRAPAPSGTAQLAGRVAAAGSGGPLREVEIALTTAGARGRRLARTDPSGRFRFGDLAAGRYWLRASKPGYVALRFGAADPLEPGRPVDLRDGESRGGLDFTLPRAGVISGQIADEFGEPVLDVEVRAMRYQMLQGQRRLTVASRVRLTDDLGGFRLFGLLPGAYLVSAVPRWRDPDVEVDAAADGTYAPTFYPGTIDLAQARSVKVGLGEEVPGVSFVLMSARTARVTGTVTDSAGEPAPGAEVSAVRREQGNVFVTIAETRARRDGSFELSRLPSGSYSVQGWVRGAAPDREPEFGAMAVQLADGEVQGIVLRTDRGGTLRGRLVLRPDPAAPAARFKPSLVEVTARPAAQDVRLTAGRASAARVGADGTFELRGLSGARLLRVSGVPAPWALDAIYLGDRDVTDTPVTLKSGSVTSGLEVVLTSRTTEVTGTVELTQPGRSRQATVLVFPAEPSDWDPQSRRVQLRRPDGDGRFTIRGLPSGDYLAVAVPYVWQGEWGDEQFLDRARAAATRFTLPPLGSKALHLKMSAVTP